jgi:hypothetical protein
LRSIGLLKALHVFHLTRGTFAGKWTKGICEARRRALA